jgi:hypothetical protein
MLKPIDLPEQFASKYKEDVKVGLDQNTGRIFVRGPYRRYLPICLMCGELILNASAAQKYCDEHQETARREYFQRPDVKAKKREYAQRPDVKAKMREYKQRWYRQHRDKWSKRTSSHKRSRRSRR